MLIYTVAVFGIVLLTSVLLLYLLNRFEMLNYRITLAISLSSVLASLLLPGIFYFMSKGRGTDMIQLSFTFAATIVLFIILVFILGTIITVVVPGNTLSILTAGLKKVKLNGGSPEERQIEEAEPENIRTANSEPNYLEEIYGRLVAENARNTENIGEDVQETENNLEKSVDTEQNIDKMGLEVFEQENSIIEENIQYGGPDLPVDITEETAEAGDEADAAAENLSIEECLEEAFRLKVQEDFEGAILYFMYALDKKPGKELAFWLALEICVLYKLLGQIEFAREMLASYYDNYSGIMDAGIRDEIERNLIYN